MNHRRRFISLAILAGVSVFFAKPAQAQHNHAFHDWALATTEVSRTPAQGAPLFGGYGLYTGSASAYIFGGGGWLGTAQGAGLITATCQRPSSMYANDWKFGSAYYNETVVVMITLTRTATLHPEEEIPASLHIASNSVVTLDMPQLALTSTECSGSAGWSVSEWQIDPYTNQTTWRVVMDQSKAKGMQSPSGWVVKTLGTGNGHVYLKPISTTGNPNNIGATMTFFIKYINGSSISAGRFNPSAAASITLASTVIGEYSLAASPIPPQSFTPIPL